MKKYLENKEWEKIVVIEEREFKIRFWYDSWKFFYTSIEEKMSKKPTFFNKKDYYFEPICDEYWIDETETNPVEMALEKIKKCLATEKQLEKIEKILDNFCI